MKPRGPLCPLPAGRPPMSAGSSPAGPGAPGARPSSSPTPPAGEGPAPAGPPPGRLLEEVLAIVRDRQATYGPPAEHWATTILLINDLFADYLRKPLPTSAWPKFLILDKLVRSITWSYIRAHAADVAGYASGWAEVEAEREGGG